MSLALLDKDPDTEMLSIHRLQQVQVRTLSPCDLTWTKRDSSSIIWVHKTARKPSSKQQSCCAMSFRRSTWVNDLPADGKNAACTADMQSH
jgi:hypothetical protein